MSVTERESDRSSSDLDVLNQQHFDVAVCSSFTYIQPTHTQCRHQAGSTLHSTLS